MEVAQPLVAQTQALYPSLAGCSFDKGYHSRANREQLDTMLKVNALPQKGAPVEGGPVARGGPGIRGGATGACGGRISHQ